MAKATVGKMDSYVEVQNPSTTADNIGGLTTTYATARKVLVGEELVTTGMWIHLTPLTGYRELQYNQIVNGKPYDFECIYPQDFTFSEKSLIVYGTKKLHVHSIINIDEHTRTARGIAYEKT